MQFYSNTNYQVNITEQNGCSCNTLFLNRKKKQHIIRKHKIYIKLIDFSYKGTCSGHNFPTTNHSLEIRLFKQLTSRSFVFNTRMAGMFIEFFNTFNHNFCINYLPYLLNIFSLYLIYFIKQFLV